MTEETVVPFLNAAAKRASDELLKRKQEAETRAAAGGGSDIEAVENILQALEGLQVQVQALIDLVVAQDARIEKLEKAKPGRIISAR